MEMHTSSESATALAHAQTEEQHPFEFFGTGSEYFRIWIVNICLTIGIHPNQTDPGWWVLLFLEKVGLVWRIKKPEDLPARPELVPINDYEHAERRTAVSL